MTPRRFVFATDEVVLPRGTRVILKVKAQDNAGEWHRPGVHGVVREVRGRVYTVATLAGAVLVVPRDQLLVEREDSLAALGVRQFDYATLRAHVIHAAVVGSRAWGLADENSDEDVRGCFVLPFEDHASVYDAPDEIHEDEAQEAYWEVEKLVRQGLRADPNTLETLWSPLIKESTPLGSRLVDERAMFSSMNVLGSFGRYAASQLKKLERSQLRRERLQDLLAAMASGRVASEAQAKALLPDDEDVHALVRSLFDRGLLAASSFVALQEALHELGAERLLPEEVRPKNAYNLVRLLHSCRHWLEHGTPLIAVEGVLKDELLAIKRSEVPLTQTLARAFEIADSIDDAARACTKLPEAPDFAAADAFLRAARRQAARVVVGADGTSLGATSIAGPPPDTDLFALRFFPQPLPSDVDVSALRRFVEVHWLERLQTVPARPIFFALTGAHAYGFPSPDSDLDLKAMHVVPAARLLGLRSAPAPLERVVPDWEGREMDLSSHDMGLCADLLVKGNGNMLERLLGPSPVVTTPLGEELALWAKHNLSRRVVHHYRGFFGAMLREHALDIRDRGGPRAKRLLYMYRVIFTGAHLLRAGELVTDVRVLAPEFGFAAAVQELCERKRSAEKATLSDEEVARLLPQPQSLFDVLDRALASSPLPEGPPAEDALSALLVRARLAR